MRARETLMAMAVLAAAACGGSGGEQAEEARGVPVTVAQVRTGDVEVVERTVGRVESVDTPLVGAQVPGRVVEVLRDAGDRVAAGEVLARIDDADYRNALERGHAALERARALHVQHRLTVQRYRALVERESAARSQLDDAEAQLASVAAQVREAQAQLDDARTALQRTQVAAPVDGTIQERMVSVGDYVGVGEPLFRMTAPDRLRVVLPFPGRMADALAVGQTVHLSLVGRDGSHHARIGELRPMIGAANQSLEAIVVMDNPGGWRPGARANGAVVLEVRQRQALVPASAVVQRPAGQVVFLVDDGHARQRVVRVGVAVDGELEILDGVSPGQRVAVDGAGFLSDGARVTVRDESR